MSNDTEEITSKNNSEVEERIDEETSKNDESTDEVVDYRVELEKERKLREKAESDRDNYKKGMLKAKNLKKKKVDEWGEPVEDDEIDQEELINQRVQEVIKSQSRDITNQLRSSRVDEMLDDVASSEDEKELIKFHLEHTINPSGNLRRDIQDAQLIANRKKLYTENSELKLALKAKGAIRNSSVGSGVNTSNKVTAEDRELKKLHEEARETGDMNVWAKVLEKRLNK